MEPVSPPLPNARCLAEVAASRILAVCIAIGLPLGLAEDRMRCATGQKVAGQRGPVGPVHERFPAPAMSFICSPSGKTVPLAALYAERGNRTTPQFNLYRLPGLSAPSRSRELSCPPRILPWNQPRDISSISRWFPPTVIVFSLRFA